MNDSRSKSKIPFISKVKDVGRYAGYTSVWLVIVVVLALACDILHHLMKHWEHVGAIGMGRLILSAITPVVALTLACALLAAILADYAATSFLGVKHSIWEVGVLFSIFCFTTWVCVLEKQSHENHKEGLSDDTTAWCLGVSAFAVFMARFVVFVKHRKYMAHP